MKLDDFNLADLRAFVAQREAEAALAAEETPAQRFCAELQDHRISGPALADVFGRILSGLDQLGVDVFAPDGAELRDAQAPADPPATDPTDLPPVDVVTDPVTGLPVDTEPADTPAERAAVVAARKGGKS